MLPRHFLVRGYEGVWGGGGVGWLGEPSMNNNLCNKVEFWTHATSINHLFSNILFRWVLFFNEPLWFTKHIFAANNYCYLSRILQMWVSDVIVIHRFLLFLNLVVKTQEKKSKRVWWSDEKLKIIILDIWGLGDGKATGSVVPWSSDLSSVSFQHPPSSL